VGDGYLSTLNHMQNTGKDIAAIFAGNVDQDKAMSMTQALLGMMESDSPRFHDSRMMLLGALAALGQELTSPFFADIGGAHAPPPEAP
jgi:hypothetical protein